MELGSGEGQAKWDAAFLHFDKDRPYHYLLIRYLEEKVMTLYIFGSHKCGVVHVSR